MKFQSCRFFRTTLLALLPLMLIILVAFIAVPAGGATVSQYDLGSISGHVIDAANGHPLAGISVKGSVFVGDYLFDVLMQTTTDVNGNYTLTGLNPTNGPPPPPFPWANGCPGCYYYFLSFSSPADSYIPQDDSQNGPGFGTGYTTVSAGQTTFVRERALTPIPWCSGPAPDLSYLHLTRGDVRWSSFADYVARNLTVDYTVFNAGSHEVYHPGITGVDNTDGVTLVTPVPLPLGGFWHSIGTGGSDFATIIYHVPDGVASFRSSVHARVMKDGTYSCYYPVF